LVFSTVEVREGSLPGLTAHRSVVAVPGHGSLGQLTFDWRPRMRIHFVPLCMICGTQVPLETCKVDESGEAVHEECYVDRLVLSARTAPLKSRRRIEWRHSALAAGVISVRVKRVPPRMPRWSVDLAAVVTVLGIIGGMAYNDQRSASEPRASNALQRHSSFLAEKPKAHKSAYKWIRVGQNEIDYIAEDVTIRYFDHEPASPGIGVGYKEVNFGEDVTVRYFAPKNSGAPEKPVSWKLTQ
jgi:hypothetical protein